MRLVDHAVAAGAEDAFGDFVFSDVAPGTYRLQVASEGFQAVEEPALELKAGDTQRNIAMTVFLTKQEVTVESEAQDAVSVDATSNASQLVLREEDLKALSDDPDALSDELQALAGPSAGPSATASRRGPRRWPNGSPGKRAAPMSRSASGSSWS